jgi:RimJ/RimL family protein N-acetyltransferase
MISKIESSRLVFRLITPADEPLLISTSCDAEVMKYITGQPRTVKEAKAELQRILKLDDGEHGFLVAELKTSGEFAGFFLVRRFENPEETEIGYRLPVSQWGKGYATEGASAVLHYIFHDLKKPYAVAVVDPLNEASRKVLLKLGFQFKKTGRYYDHELEYYVASNTTLK